MRGQLSKSDKVECSSWRPPNRTQAKNQNEQVRSVSTQRSSAGVQDKHLSRHEKDLGPGCRPSLSGGHGPKADQAGKGTSSDAIITRSAPSYLPNQRSSSPASARARRTVPQELQRERRAIMQCEMKPILIRRKARTLLHIWPSNRFFLLN